MLISVQGDLTGDFGLADAMRRDDWETVAYLLQRYFFELVALGDHLSLVRAALETMPESVRIAHPGLRPCCEFIGLEEFDEQPTFDLEHLDRGGETALLEMRRVGLTFITRRFHGRLDESRAIIEQTLPMVFSAIRRLASPAEMFASAYLLHAGVTYYLSGDLDGARGMYLASWRWRQADDTGVMTHLTGSHQAMLAALSGDLDDAERWLSASESPPEKGMSERFGLAMHGVRAIAEFVLAMERLDYPTATALLPRLPTATRHFEFGDHALWAHTRWMSLIGRSRSALRLLDSFSNLPNGADLGEGSILRRARIETLLADGRVDDALALLQNEHDVAWVRVNRARAMAMQLDHAAALELLDVPMTPNETNIENEANILRASLHYSLGDHANAREAFLTLLREWDGALYPLATIDPLVLDALFALAATHPESSAVARQWAARRHRPVYSFAHAPSLELTARERVILNHLTSGATRKEIASMEIVTINTIKSQMNSLYRKLEVGSASEAISKASSLGLI